MLQDRTTQQARGGLVTTMNSMVAFFDEPITKPALKTLSARGKSAAAILSGGVFAPALLAAKADVPAAIIDFAPDEGSVDSTDDESGAAAAGSGGGSAAAATRSSPRKSLVAGTTDSTNTSGKTTTSKSSASVDQADRAEGGNTGASACVSNNATAAAAAEFVNYGKPCAVAVHQTDGGMLRAVGMRNGNVVLVSPPLLPAVSASISGGAGTGMHPASIQESQQNLVYRQVAGNVTGTADPVVLVPALCVANTLRGRVTGLVWDEGRALTTSASGAAGGSGSGDGAGDGDGAGRSTCSTVLYATHMGTKVTLPHTKTVTTPPCVVMWSPSNAADLKSKSGTVRGFEQNVMLEMHRIFYAC
jgi:hypothetical protein